MRALQVVPPNSWDQEDERGVVALDADHRHRRRIMLLTTAGEELMVDLAETTQLADGDGLLLDGGGVIRVVAAAEDLLEIKASDEAALIRIAWHLGNRHLAAQFLDGRIRIHADRVIAEMVRGLGGTAEPVEAAFQPEAGAYAGGGHHLGDDNPEA